MNKLLSKLNAIDNGEEVKLSVSVQAGIVEHTQMQTLMESLNAIAEAGKEDELTTVEEMVNEGCDKCDCNGSCKPDCSCGCSPVNEADDGKNCKDCNGTGTDGGPDDDDCDSCGGSGEEVNESINEAQITLSINDLQSTDAETLSQMLHLAGVAEAPTMGMDDVYSPMGDMGMGDPMGMDPMADPMGDMGMDDPMGTAIGGGMDAGMDDMGAMGNDPDFGDGGFDSAPPMDGAELGPSDMDALGAEPEMDAPMDEPIDSGDYDAGFDAEMDEPIPGGSDDPSIAMDPSDDDYDINYGDDEGMDIEPMDAVPTDMDSEDDAMVMGDYAEESLDDMLALAGVDKIAEEEDDEVWANQPNVKSSGEVPGDGPNRRHSSYPAAAGGDNPMNVTERAKSLKARLKMYKGA